MTRYNGHDSKIANESIHNLGSRIKKNCILFLSSFCNPKQYFTFFSFPLDKMAMSQNIANKTTHNLKLADKKLVKLKFSYLLVTLNGIFCFKVFFKDCVLGYKIAKNPWNLTLSFVISKLGSIVLLCNYHCKKKPQKVNCKITFLATNALSTMPTALLDPEIFLKTYPMFVLYNLFQIIGTSRKVKLEILQFELCGWDLLSKCAWLSKVYIHKAFRAINGEEKNIFYKN